jgi:hypothetical protein
LALPGEPPLPDCAGDVVVDCVGSEVAVLASVVWLARVELRFVCPGCVVGAL